MYGAILGDIIGSPFEFDRGIFESIIEKVIVGGYDEDGNKDPYKITFIYKTGFKNEIGSAKERFDSKRQMFLRIF